MFIMALGIVNYSLNLSNALHIIRLGLLASLKIFITIFTTVHYNFLKIIKFFI
jgi:hypothetical protein